MSGNNARQKRKKLKKDGDYYAEIDDSKRKEKPIYLTVLQIGNRDDCGVTDTSFDAKHWRALKSTDPDAAAKYVAEHLDPRPQQVAAKECLVDICEQIPCTSRQGPCRIRARTPWFFEGLEALALAIFPDLVMIVVGAADVRVVKDKCVLDAPSDAL